MKMRKQKKGFTITELVIVIAVIAVLAAVLIPTFVSLVRRANESKDIQLVHNLNTALTIDDKEHNTMQDALDAALKAGYDVDKINASAIGNEILWDGRNKKFCYLKEGKTEPEYIPETELTVPVEELKNTDYWQICDSLPTTPKYSIYAGENWTGPTAITDLTVGFDAGKSNVTSINYKGAADGTAQNVVIRTNGGILTVNAPSDTVKHYGEAHKVTVMAIKPDSYYEYGTISVLYIESGHFVTDGNAYVTNLFANPSTGTVKVSLKTNTVGTLFYKEGGLANDSTIPESIRKEVISDNITSSESLKVVAGGKVFENISDAVAEGGDIDLIENIETNQTGGYFEEPSFTINKDSNLNLNGNTITINSETGRGGIELEEGLQTTISHGTISQNKAYGSSCPVIGANKGTLTLTDMTIELIPEADGRICVSSGTDGGAITIKDSTIKGPNTKVSNAVFCGSKSSIVIENSTVIGSIRVSTNGSLTIRGGDFTQATFYFEADITIYSGIFAKDPRNKDFNGIDSSNNVKIAEGSVVTQVGNHWIVTEGN